MINVTAMQNRLLAKGYAIGTADGVAGPKTMAAFLAAVAMRPVADMEALGAAAAKFLPAYGIMDTPARLANFTGQAAHETGSFRYLAEIWGPTAAQRGYEGRADLGNTKPGDGYRFKGRGVFQLTGRANYRTIGARIRQPLEDHPELAERPEVAMQTACEFWASRGLSTLADQGLEDAITRRINGGHNGAVERGRFVGRAKGLLA
jgi:putative chitinase